MDLSVTSAKAIESAHALAEAAHAAPETAADADPSAPPAAGSADAPVHTDTASTLVRGGFVERVLGELHTASAAAPAPVPGERVDKNLETNTLQTFARPHTPAAEQPKPATNALPAAQHAHGESSVPAAQLLPVTLVGLSIEHATQFPLNTRGFDPDPRPLFEARVEQRKRDPQHDEDTFYEEYDEPPTQHEAPPEERDAAPSAPVFEADSDDVWRAAIARTLRIALQAKVPPEALAAAAEQWQRGRCVVLACPQRADPASNAWTFVLWPDKKAADRTGRADTVSFHGVRIEARLQWSAPPTLPVWHYARFVKSHHPRTGRQLVPATNDASARMPCEVQLGPVLARTLRPNHVCLKVGAVRRFWSALGNQWSMLVVVASVPLLDAGDVVEEVSR